MEHCTTRFFEACDLDNDKYIALEEWASCFGIKESKCRGGQELGVEGRLKSTPRIPTVDEAMQYSLGVNAIPGVMSGLEESALGEGKQGAVGRVPWQHPLPNCVSLFSFHRGHRQGSCDLNAHLPALLPTLSCFNLPTSFGF